MGFGTFMNRRFRIAGERIQGGVGALSGANASRDASRIQRNSAKEATALQQAQLDKATELNEPWRQAGISALSELSSGIKSGAFTPSTEQYQPGPEYQDPQYQEQAFNFDFKADPGYAFRQQQQQEAIERSAAASGSLFSGATLSNLAQKSGQMASEEYGDAYKRARGNFESDRLAARGNFENNREFGYGSFYDAQNTKRTASNDRFDKLSRLAGIGENATARVGQSGSDFANAAGNNVIGAGNSQAAQKISQYKSTKDLLMGAAELGVKAYGAG